MEKSVTEDVQPANESAAIAAFKANPGLVPLTGVVQHYDWGGKEFIPALIGVDNAAQKPFAELWLGSHPSAPATVQLGQVRVRLVTLLENAAEQILGRKDAGRHGGRLPYLLKVLDAGKMLSIQAHPNLRQAQEGFAREDDAGIALSAGNRNYKDANHKPEVHVALTDFWMLHGFRPLEEIANILQCVPEFHGLMPSFVARLMQAGQNPVSRKALLREFYQLAMTLPQDRIDQILNPLIARLKASPTPGKSDAAYWVLRADEYYRLPGGHADRGIFSIYFLNLVHLKPGQGTYQPAGTLHAYLQGVNVELMANSDNVLRGGLTPKHMDVPELMRVLDFSSGHPAVLTGDAISATEIAYPTAAGEFALSQLRISPSQAHVSGAEHSAEILIVTEGTVDLEAKGRTLKLKCGDAALAPYGVGYTARSQTPTAVIFKAAVPS